jgi:hypothetical protein
MVRTMGINKNFDIWALAVFPESVPGTLNTALMGNLKNMDHVGNYISANAYMYDFYVVGSGGYSFGSNGTPLWAPLFEMPEEASQPQLGPIADYGNFKETRYFGKVKLEVVNTAAKQSVLITANGKYNTYCKVTVTGTATKSAAATANISYSDNTLHVKDLAGYTGYITNTAGSVVSTYVITSSDDVKTVNLNKGVYGFTAVKGTEKVSVKFVVK